MPMHSSDWLIFRGQELTYAGHGIWVAPNKEIAYTFNDFVLINVRSRFIVVYVR